MEIITCGNIRFSRENIGELYGARVIVSIPRTDITSISLRYGESVERPILEIIVGIFLMLAGFFVGIWPLVGYLSSFDTQKGGYLMPIAFAVPLVLLGIWIIVPVFSRRYYLLIATKSGKRKLAITGCSPSEVSKAGKALGYSINEQDHVI
jgi:hypothetical protein